jgi:outer membrane biosynthesis protein TonB
MADENVILHTSDLEERVMKATGLTKNVVCKMLCDANETDDEVEKARILSHILWHMPAGQLAQSEVAKAAKKELVTDLAAEIGTEVPDEYSSVEIVTKPEVSEPETSEPEVDEKEEEKEPTEEEPVLKVPEVSEKTDSELPSVSTDEEEATEESEEDVDHDDL